MYDKNQKRRVLVSSEREVFKQAIFRVFEARLRYERFDGTMTDEIVRLNFDRGDSAAALVHNVRDDLIVLTEQFRYPTYREGPGWIVEMPAGMVDGHESPVDAIRREIEEEIGYRVGGVRQIGSFYMSPGGSSERIHCFYCAVDGDQRVTEGGGDPREGEDIRVVTATVDDLLAQLSNGRIEDAKTAIMLQWLALHRQEL